MDIDKRVSIVLAALLMASLLLGCETTEEENPAKQITAAVSEAVSTVVTVSWLTDEPTIGYVEFGVTEELGMATPIPEAPAAEHSVLLLGLTPETECYYRVVTMDGEETLPGEIMTVTTGAQPGGLPTISVFGEGHDKYTLVPSIGENKTVAIINAEGKYVWYHVIDSELDTYRARLSSDGQSILYNAGSISGDPAENSELVRMSLDGLQTETIPIPLLAHDFVELPDGTLAALAVEYGTEDGPAQGGDLKGNKIVEIAPDGTQTTVWTSWDCFDPVTQPGDDTDQGWTFSNALDYDPVEDAYYLGMRSFSSIAKIPRSSFTCEWVFGNTAATITFAEGSTPMLHEHQFEVLDNSILVFDNDGLPGLESRAVEYSIDFNSGLATQIWSYRADPSVFTFVLGAVTRLDNGDTLVNWGSAGQIDRVSSDGTLKWQISIPMGTVFGFHTVLDSLY